MDEFVELLGDADAGRTVPQLLAAERKNLQRPGLYSWWVDGDGAEELSRALSRRVDEGLIYAGQAGATRWPSGRRSSSTLWERLVGMHLGKKHEFSTFRRTLAALLDPSEDAGEVDEQALTAWMAEHLRVVAIATDDADLLGELEDAVLQRLDPPLNLEGMAASPLRGELKRARKPLSRRKQR